MINMQAVRLELFGDLPLRDHQQIAQFVINYTFCGLGKALIAGVRLMQFIARPE
jgi:hypothetical protein